MKTRRNLYIVLGSVLVMLNVLSDIVDYSSSAPFTEDMSFNVGYVIGGHLLLIFGLLFFWRAHKLNKKIQSKDEVLLESSIHAIGREEA